MNEKARTKPRMFSLPIFFVEVDTSKIFFFDQAKIKKMLVFMFSTLDSNSVF